MIVIDDVNEELIWVNEERYTEKSDVENVQIIGHRLVTR